MATLSDLTKDDKNKAGNPEKVSVENSFKPNAPEPVAKSPLPQTNDEPVQLEDGAIMIPSDANPVSTWEEKHEQNLAVVHPDIRPAGPPSEAAMVVRTVTEPFFAGENEEDDKGRKGHVVEDVVNEFAPEAETDDKGRKN